MTDSMPSPLFQTISVRFELCSQKLKPEVFTISIVTPSKDPRNRLGWNLT